MNCTYGSGASRGTPQSYIRHLEAEVKGLQALLRERGLRTSGEGEQRLDPYEEDAVETIVSAEDEFMYLEPSSEDESKTFHGPFSGLGVLRSLRELCDEVTGAPRSQYGRLLAAAFDSQSLGVSTINAIASMALLPSREVVQTTIRVAIDEALCCQEFIDRSALRNQLQRLYTTDSEDYVAADRRTLSLVYALLALGRQRKIDDLRPGIIPG